MASANGWVKDIYFSDFGISPASLSGGSMTTYYCDYGYFYSGTPRILLFGGYYRGAREAGMFRYNYDKGATYSSDICCPILEAHPLS